MSFRVCLLLSLIQAYLSSSDDVQINIFGRFGLKRFNFTASDFEGLLNTKALEAKITVLEKKIADATKFHAGINSRIKVAEESTLATSQSMTKLESKVRAVGGLVTIVAGIDTRVTDIERKSALLKNTTAGLCDRLAASERNQQTTHLMIVALMKENNDINSSVATQKTRMGDIERRLHAEISNRTADVADLHIRLANQNKPFVAFVAIANKRVNTTVNAKVIFSDVSLNMGGGFEESTGRFVAPRPGYYQFHVTLLARHLHETDFQLSVNGKVFLSIRSGIALPQSSSSNSGLVRMLAAEEAFVQSKGKFEVHETSSFSGYLVRDD